MEFTRRGPASDAADDDGHRRFPDPPPHGDPMATTRDALLAQLQKDRLRQEIIVADIAKIERAMALRAVASSSGHHTTPGADAERWSEFGEEFVYPLRPGACGRDHYADVGEVNDPRPPPPPNKDAKRSSAGPKSGKPFLDDHTDEPSKPCRCEGKAASDETLPPEKTMTTAPTTEWELTGITIPVKRPKPPQLQWDCTVCQVKGTGEFNLLLHRAGLKHKSNAAAMESSTNAAATDQEAKTTVSTKWSCSICQVICTTELDLENHLNGERHCARIETLREELKKTAGNSEPHQNDAPQQAEKVVLTWKCSMCQAHCTCESDLRNHLRGKRHQQNVEALRKEGKQQKNQNNPPKLAKDKQPLIGWSCSRCEVKCNSELQYVNHCMTRKHQQKLEEATQSKPVNEAPSGDPNSKNISNRKTVNETPSDDPNTKNPRSDKVEKQTPFVYLCKLCDVPCNSGKMLAHHRAGKKHTDKVKKLNELGFCEVCDLQCNSQKMLAHHRSGKKHLQNVETQRSPYYCEVCDLLCSGEKTLTSHRYGKKHRAKFSEK